MAEPVVEGLAFDVLACYGVGVSSRPRSTDDHRQMVSSGTGELCIR